jgi:hypothetical protein
MEEILIKVSLHEFSVIIEALDKYHEKFDEASTEAGTLSNLIGKLDEQGLVQLGFK